MSKNHRVSSTQAPFNAGGVLRIDRCSNTLPADCLRFVAKGDKPVAIWVLACVNLVSPDPVVHHTGRDTEDGGDLAYAALVWFPNSCSAFIGYVRTRCNSVPQGTLYLGIKGDEKPATWIFSGYQPAFVDPVVDGGATHIQLLIAVGTVLSDGPPHRSQRAELPHWALA